MRTRARAAAQHATYSVGALQCKRDTPFSKHMSSCAMTLGYGSNCKVAQERNNFVARTSHATIQTYSSASMTVTPLIQRFQKRCGGSGALQSVRRRCAALYAAHRLEQRVSTSAASETWR